MADKAQAAAGFVAALQGLNAAAEAYHLAYGRYPRVSLAVADLLLTPLSALQPNYDLQFAPFIEMDADTRALVGA